MLKGPSEILRDIRTSTYQICRIEENTNRTNKFNKWTCNLTLLVRNICWKYCEKGEKLLEQFLLLSTIFSYLMLDFYVKTRIRFSLRDKRLFEITEVEITRVDCMLFSLPVLTARPVWKLSKKKRWLTFGTVLYLLVAKFVRCDNSSCGWSWIFINWLLLRRTYSRGVSQT